MLRVACCVLRKTVPPCSPAPLLLCAQGRPLRLCSGQAPSATDGTSAFTPSGVEGLRAGCFRPVRPTPGLPKCKVPVDLFQVIQPRQWGVIYAIRTGPGDFNKLLVTSQWFGGACPKDRKVAGGRVWFIAPDLKDLARMPASRFARLAERGEIDASMIPTPTEEDFFRQLGVPCWPPEQRTERRLMQFVRQSR